MLLFFPYAAVVESNETLYGGDPKFLSEINKVCETLIGQILDHLKTLGREEVRLHTTQNVQILHCFVCIKPSISSIY